MYKQPHGVWYVVVRDIVIACLVTTRPGYLPCKRSAGRRIYFPCSFFLHTWLTLAVVRRNEFTWWRDRRGWLTRAGDLRS